MMTIHSRNENWRPKLLTEIQGRLSMNGFSMGDFEIIRQSLTFYPNAVIFQPRYPLRTIWKAPVACPSGQGLLVWESYLRIGIWTRSRFLYEGLRVCLVFRCIPPNHHTARTVQQQVTWIWHSRKPSWTIEACLPTMICYLSSQDASWTAATEGGGSRGGLFLRKVCKKHENCKDRTSLPGNE